MDDASAEYLRAVEQRFVTLRGRGMMLSPRDVGLVKRWCASGVPVRIVLRAIEDGIAAFVDRNASGTPLPGSLAYFESRVEKAALLWRERTMSWGGVTEAGAGRTQDRGELLEAVVEAVTAAGTQQEDAAIKAVLRDTWRALRQSMDQDDGEPWALIATLDADMVRAVETTLDEPTRKLLRTEAEAKVSARGGDGMSESARAVRVDEAVVAVLRERFGLPDLVEVMSDVGV